MSRIYIHHHQFKATGGRSSHQNELSRKHRARDGKAREIIDGSSVADVAKGPRSM